MTTVKIIVALALFAFVDSIFCARYTAKSLIINEDDIADKVVAYIHGYIVSFVVHIAVYVLITGICASIYLLLT